MTSTEELDVPWIEIQFLGKAADILCQSRRTLMYTYVFAFYQEQSNEVYYFHLFKKHISFSNKTGFRPVS
jgi:hypothetical protein